MKSKTSFITTILMMLCGMFLLSSAAYADVSLQDITAAVTNNENAINDLRVEYTCIRIPYGSKGRELTSAEQAKVDRYPGAYKQEAGVYTQKGSKLRLDRTFNYALSDTLQLQQSIAYDDSKSYLSEDGPDSSVCGVVSSGRTHNFRIWFNPVLTVSAIGDKKLSDELSSYDAELDAGDYKIDDVDCKLVKLYMKNNKDNVVRSIKAYLDPARNYALLKSEKYWNDFECLERVVEVKEFTTINGIDIPSKAVCITYNRPDVTKDSIALSESELNVTDIKVNQENGIADSTFQSSFAVGTRVWDEIFEANYTIK